MENKFMHRPISNAGKKMTASHQQFLKENPDVKLLHQLFDIPRWYEDDDHPKGVAIILDIEGSINNIRELAFVGVSYSKRDGKLYELLFEFNDVHKMPNYMVQGIVDLADILIAHSAVYDRPIFDARFPFFQNKPWACSLKGINWEQYGFRHQSLGYLLERFGWHFEEHTAMGDAKALTQLLAEQFENGFVMDKLLQNAREPKIRVHAPYAPRTANEVFKRRGYDFNEDYILSPSKKGTWYIDKLPEKANHESIWLKEKWNVESILTEITPQKNYTQEIICGISA
jgi:hypothetical protein